MFYQLKTILLPNEMKLLVLFLISLSNKIDTNNGFATVFYCYSSLKYKASVHFSIKFKRSQTMKLKHQLLSHVSVSIILSQLLKSTTVDFQQYFQRLNLLLFKYSCSNYKLTFFIFHLQVLLCKISSCSFINRLIA